MIEVRNISKKFKQQTAVDHISFKVDEGENFVFDLSFIFDGGCDGCAEQVRNKCRPRKVQAGTAKG